MTKHEKVMRSSDGPEDRVTPKRSLTRREFLKVAGSATIALGVAPWAPLAPPMAGPTSAPAAMPALEGTGWLIYGSTHEMESIDPAVGFTLWSRYVQDNVYDALFRFTDVPPRLVNHLAKSYEVSDDGLTWNFHLQEGVKFHDGSVLKASDVVYTMQRMLALQDAPSFLWASVDPGRLEAIDDYTVKIVLKEPFGIFLYTLPWLYIVNEKLVRAHEVSRDWGKGWMRNNDAGSGPFMITSFDPSVRIDHARFPEYWKGWPGKWLDGWAYEIHRETATLKELLRTGKVHLTDRLNMDDYSVVAKYPGVRVVENVTMTPFQFKLNGLKEPTSNKDFREALTYALDYAAIVQGLLQGRGSYLEGPVPSSFKGSVRLLSHEQNIDRAKQYLQQSGYQPGKVAVTYGYVAGDPLQENMGLVLRDSLKKLDIEVKVEPVDSATLMARYARPETTANVSPIWASSDYPDAASILYPQYHSREPGKGTWYTCSWYNNKKVDDLLDLARTKVKEEDRLSIYEQVQQILVEDAVDIWVYVMPWPVATRECVKGYVFQPAGKRSTYFYPMYLENC